MTNNIDINQFNDFINNANSALSCDADCQDKKKRNELKKKYLEAKTNLLTAPVQLETTYKNYLTYTKGDDAYNEYQERELQEKAKTIVSTLNLILVMEYKMLRNIMILIVVFY